ncbi:hypothetical protein ABIE62_001808 [Porphyrobacter sp. MBR-155]|jgi:hypothetical protein
MAKADFGRFMQATLTGRARVGKQVGLASLRDKSRHSGNGAELDIRERN